MAKWFRSVTFPVPKVPGSIPAYHTVLTKAVRQLLMVLWFPVSSWVCAAVSHVIDVLSFQESGWSWEKQKMAVPEQDGRYGYTPAWIYSEHCS